jgi:hypothetical protein
MGSYTTVFLTHLWDPLRRTEFFLGNDVECGVANDLDNNDTQTLLIPFRRCDMAVDARVF